MAAQLIARQYQLTSHMKHVGEADYYAGIDITTLKPVALRLMNINEKGAVGIGLEHFAAQKRSKMMENEKRIMEKLNHRGLLEILDVGFDDPIYYQVFPPFDFYNLQMRIEKRGSVPVRDALNYLLEIATTLSWLHSNAIIHCDVSAETILLLDQRIKLIEFAIASHEQSEGTAPGNPPYMSPEVITGAAPAPTHDIWSLGVTIYYALTGELPFGDIELPRDVGARRLFRSILSETAKPLTAYNADIRSAVAALVNRMIEKDVSKRISTMADVVAETRRILDQQSL